MYVVGYSYTMQLRKNGTVGRIFSLVKTTTNNKRCEYEYTTVLQQQQSDNVEKRRGKG